MTYMDSNEGNFKLIFPGVKAIFLDRLASQKAHLNLNIRPTINIVSVYIL